MNSYSLNPIVNQHAAYLSATASSPCFASSFLELIKNGMDVASKIDIEILGNIAEATDSDRKDTAKRLGLKSEVRDKLTFIQIGKIIIKDNGSGITHNEVMIKLRGCYFDSASHKSVTKSGRNGVGFKTIFPYGNVTVITATSDAKSEMKAVDIRTVLTEHPDYGDMITRVYSDSHPITGTLPTEIHDRVIREYRFSDMGLEMNCPKWRKMKPTEQYGTTVIFEHPIVENDGTVDRDEEEPLIICQQEIEIKLSKFFQWLEDSKNEMNITWKLGKIGHPKSKKILSLFDNNNEYASNASNTIIEVKGGINPLRGGKVPIKTGKTNKEYRFGVEVSEKVSVDKSGHTPCMTRYIPTLAEYFDPSNVELFGKISNSIPKNNPDFVKNVLKELSSLEIHLRILNTLEDTDDSDKSKFFVMNSSGALLYDDKQDDLINFFVSNNELRSANSLYSTLHGKISINSAMIKANHRLNHTQLTGDDKYVKVLSFYIKQVLMQVNDMLADRKDMCSDSTANIVTDKLAIELSDVIGIKTVLKKAATTNSTSDTLNHIWVCEECGKRWKAPIEKTPVRCGQFAVSIIDEGDTQKCISANIQRFKQVPGNPTAVKSPFNIKKVHVIEEAGQKGTFLPMTFDTAENVLTVATLHPSNFIYDSVKNTEKLVHEKMTANALSIVAIYKVLENEPAKLAEFKETWAKMLRSYYGKSLHRNNNQKIISKIKEWLDNLEKNPNGLKFEDI